jgi:phage tail-like protein
MSADTSQLTIQLHGAIWATIPLSELVLRIGRAPDNDLVLPEADISRYHAEVRLESEGPVLTDLNSANGTFVESTRLLGHQPRLLTGGTVFQIGGFIITYQAAEQVRKGDEVAALSTEEPSAERLQQPAGVTTVPPPASLMTSRATLPVPLATGPLSGYQSYLPVVYQDSDFLGRFLLIFESMWEPLEQRQDHIAMYFDPRTCPASFLPWLAGWLGLSFYAHWPEERVRSRLSEAMDLYRWRGTSYGLVRMIEVCTGLTPQITDEPDQPFVFRVQLSVPHGIGVDLELVEALIKAHKPAHSGYILDVHQ